MKRAFWLLLIAAVLCTIVGVAPLAIAGTAQAIANAHGCRLDEGSAHLCVIAGSDWGGTLYAMGLVGWLSLLTIWLLLLAVPLWLAWLIVGIVWIARRASPPDVSSQVPPAVPPAPGAVR